MKRMVTMDKDKLWELCNEVEHLRQRNKMLEEAVASFMSKTESNPGSEVLVPRTTFCNIYNGMVATMLDTVDDAEKSPVYTKDMYVSWNGIKCNCQNGAAVSNYIVSAIEDIEDEYDGDEWNAMVDPVKMSDYIESEYVTDDKGNICTLGKCSECGGKCHIGK